MPIPHDLLRHFLCMNVFPVLYVYMCMCGHLVPLEARSRYGYIGTGVVNCHIGVLGIEPSARAASTHDCF